MGKIFYLMGKSSTGKDTIYRQLLGEKQLQLKPVVMYTTRPIRVGEKDGRDYHFINEAALKQLQAEGKIIELRSYETFHGTWKYLTVDDGTIGGSEDDFLMIGTLESYRAMRRYFGQERLVPIMIELDDGVRLQRALDREMKQEYPKYSELCRRFLADAEDFASDRIMEAGITKSFYNEDFPTCMREIVNYIQSKK